MSLSTLLLGVWLILVGLTWTAWAVISTKFLGVWAFVTGIVMLVKAWHLLNIPRP